jgi:carbon-monoxide dehydrogenase small subunit
MLNGRTVKSCCVLAADVAGQEITTIEALSSSATDLHPIQQAFVANQGLQCGYCTPGVLMTMKAFLDETPRPDEAQIREALSGNLCRCTGYTRIFEAVVRASAGGPASERRETSRASVGGPREQ